MKESTIESRLIKAKDLAVKFLNGNLYPFLVALFVLIGHITALEFYFNIPIILTATFGLIFSPTLKPFIVVLTTFLYQINFKHSPGDFLINPDTNNLDPGYYARPEILTGIVILAVLVFSAVIYRFIRFSVLKMSRRTPLLLPITLLCFAFVLSGAFSIEYTVYSLFYGLAQVIVYFIIFYLFYFGLRDIPSDELISYISYIALLNAMVLIGEVSFMYLTYEHLISDNGSIIKEWITLGWGISNPIAFCLASLIPMLCYGAMTKKIAPVYFLAAIGCFVCAIFTLSKNAFVFATLTLLVCLVYGCIRGKNKKIFRIMTGALVLLGIVTVILLFDKVFPLFKEYISRGFNDNGRFKLWRRAFEDFLEAPLFGIGFFAFGDINTPTFVSILPTMAHNTIFVLMSATGSFGLLSYVYYRFKTLYPLLKNPSEDKTALLITFGTILAMSLLDNYVFYIYTMFYYTIVLAISVIVTEKEQEQE